jgi:hypothetical protein
MEKKIQVIYHNGSTGVVNQFVLDYLIDGKEIVAFMRSDGWVRIASDPIRSRKYKLGGPGRRARNHWSVD